MRRIYIVPNFITAFSLAAGLFVIFKVNLNEPGAETYKTVLTSSIILLLAACADWFDGMVARAMHAESEFGRVFDSLADAITFGVAPTVLLLKTLSLERGTPLSFLAIFGAMIFSICGILRLARFNVLQMVAKRVGTESKKQLKHFVGLPIPAAALALVGANLLFVYPKFLEWLGPPEMAQPIALTIIAVTLGYFMVSRFKFPSAKVLHFRLPSFHLVFFAVFFAIFLLYGVLYFFPFVLTIATWVYILLGWTLAAIRLIAGKKSKTLEDFEPDQDE